MLLLLGFVTACAEPECAATRDLLASPAGLALTEQEHPAGWGRTACFQCHQASRIHREDCLDDVAVDGAAINAAVDPADTSTCVACHGSNGHAEWDALLDEDSGS